MRVLIVAATLLIAANTLHAQGAGLQPGQVLFTHDRDEQRVETSEIQAVLTFGGTEAQLLYRIELTDQKEGIQTRTDFAQDPGELKLTAYNESYYCDELVLFLTLRYLPPRFADIRQYRLETHAFRAASMTYLDTVLAAFEDIAPHETKPDLEFPYTQPQPYQVACSADKGRFTFRFFAKDESSD